MHDPQSEFATPRPATQSSYTALARRLRGESMIERPAGASSMPRSLALSPLARRLQAMPREDQHEAEPQAPSRSGVYALGIDDALREQGTRRVG